MVRDIEVKRNGTVAWSLESERKWKTAHTNTDDTMAAWWCSTCHTLFSSEHLKSCPGRQKPPQSCIYTYCLTAPPKGSCYWSMSMCVNEYRFKYTISTEPTLTGGHAYFHSVVPLLLRSWQSLAGCSAVAPTGKTGVPESGRDPGEHCSGWLLCRVYGESWAGLQMQGRTRHWWQGKERGEDERINHQFFFAAVKKQTNQHRLMKNHKNKKCRAK